MSSAADEIQRDTISARGMELEAEVRRVLDLTLEWELMDMQTLLLALIPAQLVVQFEYALPTGWWCIMAPAGWTPPSGSPRQVQECGNASPGVALARAALAAMKAWSAHS